MTRRNDIGTCEKAQEHNLVLSQNDNWRNSLGDALLLVCVILTAALAVAAFAVAAPLILAVSALMGLLARNGARKGWRAARAQ